MAMDDLLKRMVDKVSLHPEARITISDIAAWAGSTTDGDLYNAISFGIMEQYHNGALGYTVCDQIMNDLWDVVKDCFIPVHNKVPTLFYDVYLAFDAGEYYRTADRSDDPVAERTKPMIEEILLHGSLRT
jgi:hypothetical protein